MATSVDLERLIEFLRSEVTPKAQQIDQSTETLKWAQDGLFALGAMNLRAPAEYGGPNLDSPSFRKFQEAVARASGSLAFLQTQHQSAVSLILTSESETLKKHVVPQMRFGERRIGIGVSQLRRGGTPTITATRADGGYIVTGNVPWITGWTFFDSFVLGARLPENACLLAIAPLQPSVGLNFSEPMRLAAMESAQTVSAEFSDFWIPDAEVIGVQPPDFILKSDLINVVLQGHFALGCAEAGLDVLRMNATQRGRSALLEAHEKLSAELNLCRTAMAEATLGAHAHSSRVDLRAWAIELCTRCAHAGVVSSAGAANSMDHPAQRIFRESLVYTVSAQTSDIMDASLLRLSKAYFSEAAE